MAYNKNIHENALRGMFNGIAQAAALVKPTMGAGGKNVVIEVEQPPYHIVTNDGATIIEHINLEDPVERIGLDFLKEVVARSNKNAGDGSSTTTVVVEKIVEQGMYQNGNGMEIMHSLNECLPIIESSINKQKKIISEKDFDKLKQVATISGEDEKVGELLAEIYQKIGKSGIIHPEYVLGKEGISYSFIQGVRFANGTGYLSPEMVHDEEAIKEKRKETKAVYENPAILVTKRKIMNISEITPLFNALKGKKDLVIFANDMDSQIASFMIATHKDRKTNPLSQFPRITIIKAPVLWNHYVFEDFAKCVGAKIVEDATGLNFKNLTLNDLGTCEKIIIDKDETVIIGTQDLSDHLAELAKVVEEGDVGDNDYARRLSWLTSKTVLLKIGGMSDTELSYKRLKLEDAINATRTALEDGIVAGGGVALVNATYDLPDTLGGNILKEALKAPMEQIIRNTGVKSFEMPTDPNYGFDAKTRTWVDMHEAGIIDSARIVKNAVKNAISVSSTLLTAPYHCITIPPRRTEEALQALLAPKPYNFQ